MEIKDKNISKIQFWMSKSMKNALEFISVGEFRSIGSIIREMIRIELLDENRAINSDLGPNKNIVRFQVWMSAEMRSQLEELAKKESKSIGQLIREMVHHVMITRI